MRHPFRDLLATILVGGSLVVYVTWASGVGLLGPTDIRSVTGVVLVLGIAASMVAVVPGFEELLGGSRLYLAVASAAGLVAVGAGLWAFVGEEATALAALMAATIAMWAMSTLRHAGVHRPAPHLGHR
jgi:hypothetical protein